VGRKVLSSDGESPCGTRALVGAESAVLRLMKRERDLHAHEDADSEPQANVNDVILSFEKELDRMSETAPRVKYAAQS